MSTIVRHEFMGSWILFTVLCLSVIGLPAALLYLLNGTLRIEQEVDDPERLIGEIRSGAARK